MERIYSKHDPEHLLHIVVRKEDLTPGRVDAVPENHFIQCALLNMEKGKTFPPHRHIFKERTRNVIAQESWIVVQGSVKCTFYDIDDIRTHFESWGCIIYFRRRTYVYYIRR